MSGESVEDMYPHWRDALFGNHNAVANLRCAAHYVFWHGLYALIAIVGLLFVGVARVALAIGRKLGPLAPYAEAGYDGFVRRVRYVVNHDYTESLATVLFVVLAISAIVVGVGFIAWFIWTNFWLFVEAIGFSLALMVGLGVVYLVGRRIWPRLTTTVYVVSSRTASGARATAEKATQTPGIRRVYGECPVNVEMAPKWFDNLFPEEL